MTQKISNCNVILSDSGEVVTINVDASGDGIIKTDAAAIRVDGGNDALKNLFDRHGEEIQP